MAELVIRGARENNLKGIDLDLPRDQVIVFTGVSGSGKTSLAFDTLHAEGQRRYLEALAMSVPGIRSRMRQARVDVILGLPPTIALEQGFRSPGVRSTVATWADLSPLLRTWAARECVLHCPQCDEAVVVTPHDRIVGRVSSWPEGTRLSVEAPLRVPVPERAGGVLDEVVRAGFSRLRLDDRVERIEDVTPAQVAACEILRIVVDRIRLEPGRSDRIHDAVRTAANAGHGVLVVVSELETPTFVDRPYCLRCDGSLPELEPGLLSHHGLGACPVCEGRGVASPSEAECPACSGTRLGEVARAVRWQGRRFTDRLGDSVSEWRKWIAASGDSPVAAALARSLGPRLATLEEVGLGGLRLDTAANRLSSGELQRLRLARQVGAALSGVLYSLDEPSAGLGEVDVERVVSLIRRLRDGGNSVVVVDHHRAVIAAADWVVDFGPRAGSEGGNIVFSGTPDQLRTADTLTGRWFSGREHWTEAPHHVSSGMVRMRGDGGEAILLTGTFGAIVGPSGSGKTRMLDRVRAAFAAKTRGEAAADVEGLEAFTRLIELDQSPLSRQSRSCPATYLGIWDILRELLAASTEARLRGMDASFFSMNARGGRCEACSGMGEQRIELGVLPEVHRVCEVCGGRRFQADVLAVTWKGRAADAWLAMDVDSARVALAGHPKLEASLRALADVGLGYLALGQPTRTLSGGEAQRLRLARELVRLSSAERTLMLLDDPTVGLHPADVQSLLHLIHRLVADGVTVWMATHDPALAACAAWSHRLTENAVDNFADSPRG